MHLVDFLGPAAGTALVLAVLLASGWAWRLALDQPNARSLHVRPTPRVGGLALMPVALAWCAVRGSLALAPLAAALVLVLVCFVDDRRGLPIALRFAVQLAMAAAVLLAYGAGGAPSFIVGTPGGLPTVAASVLAVSAGALAVAWMTNLYNFMDGSDGLAGGMACFGFGAYALAARLAGDDALAGASSALAGAALGFLCFNFHPARVFLGDAGSIPLGFLAAVLGWHGVRAGAWPPWFPLLVFSPFIADATGTLLARGLRGERVWQAHRTHVYQRMVAAGFGHRATALLWYALMAAAAGSALYLLEAPAARPALLGAWALAYPAAFLFARRRWRA